MLKPEKQVFDAWLASAEIPYDWLIPLLYEQKSSENVFHCLTEQSNQLHHMIPEGSRQILASNSCGKKLDEYRRIMDASKINSITIMEEGYPHCLREIQDPPGILFYQGNIDVLQRNRYAAMVGSRSATYAGLRASRRISSTLSRNGVIIVSGLAYGIDSECHRGCLEGGSPTIAVLGCGLDQAYPAGNDGLKQEILQKNGLLISEYAPGSKPIGRHFPYRNRIISGLCSVVILMEARIRSGSMTTINHALQQGKEIYSYPGDPVSAYSEANRMLIREGAHYFTEAEEILSDMNWLDNPSYVRQNIVCSIRNTPGSETESAVYNALLRGELGFDELLQATGLTSSELMSTLTLLQIKKLIEPLPGKKYRISQ